MNIDDLLKIAQDYTYRAISGGGVIDTVEHRQMLATIALAAAQTAAALMAKARLDDELSVEALAFEDWKDTNR